MSQNRRKTKFRSQNISWQVALIFAATVGCKTTNSSSTKNVGSVNTADATSSNALNMKFVKIPAGSFMTEFPGSKTGRDNDKGPQYKVTISGGFEMQTTEVTQGQWFAVTGENPSYFKESKHCPGEHRQVSGVSLCPNNPVEKVSLNEIKNFITTIEAKGDGYKYRLPSDAEWDYAARAGTNSRSGISGNLGDVAWYGDNSDDMSHPVGKKRPNAWGLSDMYGNVMEWTGSWYSGYPSDEITDRPGTSPGSYPICRGGGWYNSAEYFRSAIREGNLPDVHHNDLGFRLVRTRP